MEAVYSRLAQFSIPTNLRLDFLPTEGGVGGIRGRLAQLKGVRDFFDVRRMSKPTGWGDAQSRISYNLRYFSGNYSLLLALLVVYALLTNLLLLFVLVLALAGFFGISALRGADLVLPGGIVVAQQSLYIALAVITVPLFIIASPMATMFWLIGAAGVTILGHAVILEKPLESEFAETV